MKGSEPGAFGEEAKMRVQLDVLQIELECLARKRDQLEAKGLQDEGF